jgi:hypothetical protein
MSKAIKSLLAVTLVTVAFGVIGVKTAAAQTCSGTHSMLVSPVCVPSGWNVSATVWDTGCSTPTAVTVQVYDNTLALVESFSLAPNGAGFWAGMGACINPNVAYQVRFTATGGQIDTSTATAISVNCGGC